MPRLTFASLIVASVLGVSLTFGAVAMAGEGTLKVGDPRPAIGRLDLAAWCGGQGLQDRVVSTLSSSGRRGVDRASRSCPTSAIFRTSIATRE